MFFPWIFRERQFTGPSLTSTYQGAWSPTLQFTWRFSTILTFCLRPHVFNLIYEKIIGNLNTWPICTRRLAKTEEGSFFPVSVYKRLLPYKIQRMSHMNYIHPFVIGWNLKLGKTIIMIVSKAWEKLYVKMQSLEFVVCKDQITSMNIFSSSIYQFAKFTFCNGRANL